MLGFVHGKVITTNLENSQCIVLVNHVGYEVTVSRRFFDALTADQEYDFWLHTHVREDALVLFGFSTEEEKQFFRVLLGMSGLGPRHALSLLSEHGVEALAGYILSKDTHAISKAHGIGKKLAERLVLELGTKLEKLAFVSSTTKRQPLQATSGVSGRQQLQNDLASALSHLGYQPAYVRMTLEKIFAEEGSDKFDFEVCLKRALLELSGRTKTGGGVEANV